MSCSIGYGNPELEESKLIHVREVLRLEILHDGIGNEIGDSAGRLLKMEQRVEGYEVLIFHDGKVLARLGVPNGVKVGSPIWTKDGLWLMIRTYNGFDTQAAAIAYCELNPENPKFKFFQRSVKKNGVLGEIINLLGGDNEKVEGICAFKQIQKTDVAFYKGIIPEMDLKPMSKRSLYKLFSSHKNLSKEPGTRERQ
jgi:hypothetical protein